MSRFVLFFLKFETMPSDDEGSKKPKRRIVRRAKKQDDNTFLSKGKG